MADNDQERAGFNDTRARASFDIREMIPPEDAIEQCQEHINAPPEKIKDAPCVAEVQGIFEKLRNAIMNLFYSHQTEDLLAFNKTQHEAERDLSGLLTDPEVKERGISHMYVRTSREAIRKLINNENVLDAQNSIKKDYLEMRRAYAQKYMQAHRREVKEAFDKHGSAAAFEVILKREQAPEPLKALYRQALHDGLKENADWAKSYAKLFIAATRQRDNLRQAHHKPNLQVVKAEDPVRDQLEAIRRTHEFKSDVINQYCDDVIPDRIHEIVRAYENGNQEQAYIHARALKYIDETEKDRHIAYMKNALRSEEKKYARTEEREDKGIAHKFLKITREARSFEQKRHVAPEQTQIETEAPQATMA